MSEATALKAKIEDMVRQYYALAHKNDKTFAPGDRINYSGRVYDDNEMVHLVDAALEFWLTPGHYVAEFEQGLADYIGAKFCSLTNSGSSANLLAFAALTSPELGERRIQPGDEVITPAAAFPTTVNPIVQYGAVPVFVDITLPTYNIDITAMHQALSAKTKAVFMAHTLGNPFDLKAVKQFCEAHNLWLIEDNCDALGSTYDDGTGARRTGTFGDLSTYSFYPPHHITLGEGGAVCTSNPLLHRLVRSYRDWGRDCWCASGKDNTCQKRYTQQFGTLPFGYDHKYVYSHFGYNLNATDLQASIGCAQLHKLPAFVEQRKKNWAYLHQGLEDLQDVLILPEATEHSNPSWFGFLFTIHDGERYARADLARYLEEKNIQTRNLFAGNYLRQPCFDTMRKAQTGYRVVGELTNTDKVMQDALWIGVYPGMNQAKLDYMIAAIKRFFA